MTPPNPLYGRGSRATPSRTHPQDDLRRFAPTVVLRPLRGRLLGPRPPGPPLGKILATRLKTGMAVYMRCHGLIFLIHTARIACCCNSCRPQNCQRFFSEVTFPPVSKTIQRTQLRMASIDSMSKCRTMHTARYQQLMVTTPVLSVSQKIWC